MQAIRKQLLLTAENQCLESARLSTFSQVLAVCRNLHTSNTALQEASSVRFVREKKNPSLHSQKSVNLIRQACDKFSPKSISKKPLLAFNLGDPTNTGALPLCPGIREAVHETLLEQTFFGYGPAHGFPQAREAIAKHFSLPDALFTKDDVIMTSGGSHALQLSLEVIANPGENILLPTPGFPLYKTLLQPHNIEQRFYSLKLSSEGTQIDLEKLESAIDNRTKAILINNPSNPTGAVYPKKDLEAALQIAKKYDLPVIADEVYGDLTYNNAKFFPLATLNPKVPILKIDSISKRYLAPGWRLGWIIVYNRNGQFDNIQKGLINLSQKIVGPSALIQGALPKILDRTPKSYFQKIINLLSSNAKIAYDALDKVPGLRPIKPCGAMYLCVEIDTNVYGDERKFLQELIYEENVFCLPGSVFFYPNIFRLVLLYSNDKTVDACERITEFCQRKLSK